MTSHDLLTFLRSQRYAVEATIGSTTSIQAALVGIAVNDAFEIIFDTLGTTRKVRNLRDDPRIALVVGGWSPGDERTAQIEGTATLPSGEELARAKATYFAAWPDGRERETWPSMTYVRVRPSWIRFSDFNQSPPLIVEFSADDLAGRGPDVTRPTLR